MRGELGNSTTKVRISLGGGIVLGFCSLHCIASSPTLFAITIRTSLPTHQVTGLPSLVYSMGHGREAEGSGKIAQRISCV